MQLVAPAIVVLFEDETEALHIESLRSDEGSSSFGA